MLPSMASAGICALCHQLVISAAGCWGLFPAWGVRLRATMLCARMQAIKAPVPKPDMLTQGRSHCQAAPTTHLSPPQPPTAADGTLLSNPHGQIRPPCPHSSRGRCTPSLLRYSAPGQALGSAAAAESAPVGGGARAGLCWGFHRALRQWTSG